MFFECQNEVLKQLKEYYFFKFLNNQIFFFNTSKIANNYLQNFSERKLNKNSNTINNFQSIPLYMSMPNNSILVESSSDESFEQEYEVDEILDKRVVKNEMNKPMIQYLVKWKSYSIDQATWEPVQNLKNSKDKIKQFYQRQERKNMEEDRIADVYYDRYTGKKDKSHLRKSDKNKRVNIKQEKKNSLQQKLQVNDQSLDSSSAATVCQFDIIGAFQPDITFIVQMPNGQITTVQGQVMRDLYALKLMQFYESKISFDDHSN